MMPVDWIYAIVHSKRQSTIVLTRKRASHNNKQHNNYYENTAALKVYDFFVHTHYCRSLQYTIGLIMAIHIIDIPAPRERRLFTYKVRFIALGMWRSLFRICLWLVYW